MQGVNPSGGDCVPRRRHGLRGHNTWSHQSFLPTTIIAERAEQANMTTHIKRLNRVRSFSRLLDEQFRIPGTRYRVGLDGLLGLLPGVGDAAGTLLSTYIVYEAVRLGAPRTVLLRMLANIGIDSIVGTIPLVGDLFDMTWKANRKNVALLEKYLSTQAAEEA